MERSEIWSTLGLKTASCELSEARERRRSHGESWWDWLEKKESLEENAIPKVNPSDLWILVSAQGWYTLFVFAASEWTTSNRTISNSSRSFIGIVTKTLTVAIIGRLSGGPLKEESGLKESGNWFLSFMLKRIWKKSIVSNLDY